MAPASVKPGVIKDPTIAALFSNKDPESRYQDLREIGHGSFGAVFFAFDKSRSETVAIKKMNFSGKQASEKWSDIIKEVTFLNKIKHEHIVVYKACFLKDTTCWLVMEYCIGSAADIVDVLRKGLREVEIGAICAQTLEALHYLHSLKHIHRDIKAGNILLSDAAVVKLADFGSASLINPAQTFIGTPFFMAPEVILAMDEGHYTDRADIWSLGITCIELAERRPPLFSMNAMSALYHIAQNEPPTLAEVPSGQPAWSPEFVDFVDRCLRKPAEERMSSAECKKHPFITRNRPRDAIHELINRTKSMVMELDNFQYKKMRKLMYLDEAEGRDSETNDSGSARILFAGGSEDLDDNVPEALSLGKAGDSTSSRSNSLASFRSMQSSGGGGLAVSTSTTGGVGGSSTSAVRKRPTILNSALTRSVDMTSSSSQGPTMIPVGDVSLGTSSHDADESERDDASGSRAPSPPIAVTARDLHLHNLREEVATIGKSKFSTLRSAKLINREQEEYNKENNMHEQMSGYKRLRQQHVKEIKQCEERCTQERDVLRVKLDRELEQLTNTYGKEKQRVKVAHQNELDKKKREIEEGERKLRKQTASKNQQMMRVFATAQLKEYKHNKEIQKDRFRTMSMSRSSMETAMKEVKAQLNRQREQLEAEFETKQRAEADDELVRYRRSQLSRLHSLEEKLEEDDMNIQERQMETRQALLMKQHEMTRNLEIEHLTELHVLKKKHQDAQYESETANQNEYTRRLTEELRKKHALQSRQQPRDLKLKEQQIRKQYRQAVKTQTRQFKLWQTQLLQSVAREEQKEVSARLKEEQTRKLALLGSQYESQIKNMVKETTVKLESWQEDEARTLREKLAMENDHLIECQQKQLVTLNDQIAKERVHLEQRISTRRALLEQQIKREREELSKVRRIRLEALHERHADERQRLENSFLRLHQQQRL
ncbi:unnamed protein product [Caenorhabditis auriculariae]|uniref:non-specific serine/threonine protein kinase n=1 Tax=Caenorhabditis auriculariae TaxID=2777116 RepID=A0A8S1HNK8_9PELO|nr:unnamed protein product [Caenorhabditis auriculariae]